MRNQIFNAKAQSSIDSGQWKVDNEVRARQSYPSSVAGQRLTAVDAVRSVSQELPEFHGHALNDRVNWINMCVGSLDGVAREQVENQQTVLFIVISSFLKFFVALA